MNTSVFNNTYDERTSRRATDELQTLLSNHVRSIYLTKISFKCFTWIFNGTFKILHHAVCMMKFSWIWSFRLDKRASHYIGHRANIWLKKDYWTRIEIFPVILTSSTSRLWTISPHCKAKSKKINDILLKTINSYLLQSSVFLMLIGSWNFYKNLN